MQNGTRMVLVACAFLSAAARAQGQARESFLRQQAYSEMQRVSGQVDVLQSNLSDIQRRVGALEGGGDLRTIRQEVEALKSAVAELRREMQAQRGEIVKDLSGRMSRIMATSAPAPRPAPKRVVDGQEYTVQPGDSLYLIAQAFKTTVPRLKEMNGLKGDGLRVGQKLVVPK